MDSLAKRWKVAPLVEAGTDALGQHYIRHACVPESGWNVITGQNWGLWHRIPDEEVQNPGMDFTLGIDLICALCGLRGSVLNGQWVTIDYPSYKGGGWKEENG